MEDFKIALENAIEMANTIVDDERRGNVLGSLEQARFHAGII